MLVSHVMPEIAVNVYGPVLVVLYDVRCGWKLVQTWVVVVSGADLFEWDTRDGMMLS